jgi:ABC-type spermidine/putrescine transport system permease subunit II
MRHSRAIMKITVAIPSIISCVALAIFFFGLGAIGKYKVAGDTFFTTITSQNNNEGQHEEKCFHLIKI